MGGARCRRRASSMIYVDEAVVSDSLQFGVQVLWGAEVVGSSSERSDNSVLRLNGGGGVVLRKEVGVGGFSVN